MLCARLKVYNDERRVNPTCSTLENVVLPPRLGRAITETRDAMGRVVLSGIGAGLAGQAPPSLMT